MKAIRVERHRISNNHIAWKIIDELCFRSKCLYNHANYIIRQELISSEAYKNYNVMAKELKTHNLVKNFGSQCSQQTLRVLDRNWRSFFAAHEDWSRNSNKYLGEPRWPGYKDRNGRFQLILSNIQFRIEDGFVYFSWKPLKIFNNIFKTQIRNKTLELRFVPMGIDYMMEVVYQIEVPEQPIISNRIASIDIGLNNLVTISNNIGKNPIAINGKIIKSMNQYYNKMKAKMCSDLEKTNGMKWSNKLQRLTDKYKNKVDDFLHKTSRYIISLCIDNQIDTIVIGKNDGWKQNCHLNKNINQAFVQIPFARLIHQIEYKAENVGIKVIVTEESYTSGTSFIDGELPCKDNYDKSRRFTRGLFKSYDGTLINADVNGSYQIMRKVFPNILLNGIEDVGLHPVRINL